MNSSSFIGIDVGGTKIAGGILYFPDMRPSSPRLVPTQTSRGGRAVLQSVLDMAHALASECAATGLEAVGLGVGICELVNRGGQPASANSVNWLNLPVREELSQVAPVILEADVRAAAVAEARLGAGRPYANFLYITIGTGISCCLMLDGRPYLGARGLTGTMASSPLTVFCENCGARNERTLEELASGPALAARFRAAGGAASTGQEVLAAAAAGHPKAREIVASASENLESHVALLVNTLDPEAVVIGGGLGLSTGPYWDQFLAATRRHIWSQVHRDLPILRAETGVEAGWIGAALAAADHFQSQPGPVTRL